MDVAAPICGRPTGTLEDNHLKAVSSVQTSRPDPPIPVSAIYGSISQSMPDRLLDASAHDHRGPARKVSRSSVSPERNKPDTSRIDKSELCLMTKLACGNVEQNKRRNISVTSMIQNRLVGQGFTRGQQCEIRNCYLPNKRHQRINYHCKVYCGLHSSDGKYFLSAAEDRLLRLYHTVNGELDVFKLIPARGYCDSSILDTVFSPNGNNIVYSSWSDCLYMCSINGDPSVQHALQLRFKSRDPAVFSVAFSNDGNEIIGSSSDGHLYFYDLTEHKRTLQVKAHPKNANTVKFADNTSQILMSGGSDGLCKVWDRRTLCELDPKPVGVLMGHRRDITYIDPRGDGRHLITNSKDDTIKLWDMRVFSGTEGEENTRQDVCRNHLKYSWQQILPWELQSTSLLDKDTSIMTYRGHSVHSHLIRCRFSPAVTTGQRYIYTGSNEGCVFIYDVLSGEKVLLSKRRLGCIRDVSWHPYQPQLVSSSQDGRLETWITAPAEPEEPDDFYDCFHPIWQ